MGIITWGIEITRIELDAHHCPTFLCKMCKDHFIGKVQRRFDIINRTDIVKTSLTKCGQKYKSDAKRCLQKYYSKLRIILLTNNNFFLLFT